MELSELTDKAIDYIIDQLADESKLTDWERNFVDSISDQWNRRRSGKDLGQGMSELSNG